MTLRLLLTEDHVTVREGVRAPLEEEIDFEVVGQAGDGGEVLPLVERLLPDVVVLDLMLPGIGGLEVLRELTKRSLGARVVILSMYGNESYVLEALRSGAAAYVLKQSEPAELVRAIREVAAGRRYLGAPLSEQAVEAYARRAEGAPPGPYATLTTREREVLKLVAEGHTSPKIAQVLFISPRTVESHRAALMKKLGLKTQAEVVRYAPAEESSRRSRSTRVAGRLRGRHNGNQVTKTATPPRKATSAALLEKPSLRGVIHQYSFLVWILVAGPALLIAAHPGVRPQVAVYVVCVAAMFGVSALYHRRRWSPVATMRMRRLDRSTIFLAIAGTYTGIAGIALPPNDARWIVGIVWLGTVVGIAIATGNFWKGAPKVLTAIPYVGVGWVAVAAIPGLFHGLGGGPFTLTVAGGVLYTIGAIVFATKKPDPSPTVYGYHEVFHTLVSSAAACHLAAVASIIR